MRTTERNAVVNWIGDVASTRPNLRQSASWIALAIVLISTLILVPALVQPGHWPILMRQAAPLGLLALGQTVLVLGRGIDLSVGGVVGMVSVILAGNLAQTSGAGAVLVVCLVVGLAVGILNGALVAWGRLSPLIATLGTGFVLTGAMLIYTGGSPTGEVPEAIRQVASGRFLGLTWGTHIWLLSAVVIGIVLKFTWAGRWVRAVGANPEAARLSTVRIPLVQLGSHVVSSLCAVLAGLVLAGFVGVGTLGAGEELMLNSLAATVVGGTVLAGGRGGVSGTVGGVLLLTVLAALLTGVGAGKPGELLMQGLVILAAAFLFRTRRSS